MENSQHTQHLHSWNVNSLKHKKQQPFNINITLHYKIVMQDSTQQIIPDFNQIKRIKQIINYICPWAILNVTQIKGHFNTKP